MNTRSLIAALWLSLTLVPSAHATGIPVFDATNLQQNAVSALESVNQTIKQIEEYALQLQQYEDQIKNSLAPAAYVWSKAQNTMNKIMDLQNALNGYINTAGNMDSYLAKFGNVNTYKSSPYFGASGGSKEQAEKLMESETVGSEAQKTANDNMMRTLEQQQQALREDAANLEQIQSSATSAQGRMEAIQYANQLAAHQSNQLLQLRALMMAQQAAEAARNQTISAREARQQAADEKALESRFTESPKTNWLEY